MKPLQLLTIIMCLMLIVPVYATNHDKEKNLEERDKEKKKDNSKIKKKYDITGLKEEDVKDGDKQGDPPTIKSGEGKLGEKTPKKLVLDGKEAIIDVTTYSGTITIGENGGTVKAKNANLKLGADGIVTVNKGIVVFKDVHLLEGSTIVTEDLSKNNIPVSGEKVSGVLNGIDRVSLGLSSKLPITYGGITYLRKNQKTDSGTLHISTFGDVMVMNSEGGLGSFLIKKNNELLGTCTGSCAVDDAINLYALPSVGFETTFEDAKGNKFIARSTTTLCKIGSKCVTSSIDHVVFYNGDLIVDIIGSPTKKGEDQKLEIHTKGGTYENIIVRKINTDVPLELFIEKENGEKVKLAFDQSGPRIQGDITDLGTSVGHVYQNAVGEEIPWGISNGKQIHFGTVVGTSNVDDLFLSYLSTTKSSSAGSLIASMLGEDILFAAALSGRYGANIFDHVSLTKKEALEALESFQNKPTVQNKILSKIEGTISASQASKALIATKGNKAAQLRILKIVGETFIASHHVQDLEKVISDDIFKLYLQKISPYEGADTLARFLRARTLEEKQDILSSMHNYRGTFEFAAESSRDQKEKFDYKNAMVALKSIDKSSRNQEFLDSLVLATESKEGSRYALQLFLNRKDPIAVIKEALQQAKDGGYTFDKPFVVEALKASVRHPDLQKQILDNSKMKDNRLYGFYPHEHFQISQAFSNTQDNPEAQKLLLSIFKRSKKEFFKEPDIARNLLAYAANNEIFEDVAKNIKVEKDPGWDQDSILQVYKSKEFQKATEGFTPEARWSVAVTTQRLVKQATGQFDDPNIGTAANTIIQLREKKSDKVIAGPETKWAIVAAHDEVWPEGTPRFQAEKIKNVLIDAGVKESRIDVGKGPLKKSTILAALSNLDGKTNGPGLFVFTGHGLPTSLGLTDHLPGGISPEQKDSATGISPREIAIAFKQREISGEVVDDRTVLIFSACHTHDVRTNVYKEFAKLGVKGRPEIIVSSNRNQLSSSIHPGKIEERGAIIGGEFFNALALTKPKGQPLTYKNIFDSEKHSFHSEDISVTIPIGSSTLDLGSTDTDYHLSEEVFDRYKLEIQKNLRKKLLKPGTVIEIGELQTGSSGFT